MVFVIGGVIRAGVDCNALGTTIRLLIAVTVFRTIVSLSVRPFVGWLRLPVYGIDKIHAVH